MSVSSNSADVRTQIGHKKKIALVCSGGASKAGAFHLGVALALQEQGFKFYGGLQAPGVTPRPPGPMEISTYVGSSAGSIISSYLAAGYSLDNIFNSYLGRKLSAEEILTLKPKPLPRLTYQKMFRLKGGMSVEQVSQVKRLWGALSELVDGRWEALIKLRWLKMTGIFSTSGLEQYLREEVLPSNRFHDFLPELFIVATQLNHSRKVVFGKNSYQPPPEDLSCQYDNDVSISEACAASTALPVIFAPYQIKNRNNQQIHYIDGEIRDTLSTHVAVDSGADLVIASYTHQPFHLSHDAGSLTQFGLPAIVIQSIYLVIEQKINSAIYNKRSHRNAIDAVSQYCKSQHLSDSIRKGICSILEKELNQRMDVDTIYIHPNPRDSHAFFGEHFTLSPRRMAEIVKSGFRTAVEILRTYDFADRENKPAMGTANPTITS